MGRKVSAVSLTLLLFPDRLLAVILQRFPEMSGVLFDQEVTPPAFYVFGNAMPG
jgi:hypothetical protein